MIDLNQLERDVRTSDIFPPLQSRIISLIGVVRSKLSGDDSVSDELAKLRSAITKLRMENAALINRLNKPDTRDRSDYTFRDVIFVVILIVSISYISYLVVGT